MASVCIAGAGCKSNNGLNSIDILAGRDEATTRDERSDSVAVLDQISGRDVRNDLISLDSVSDGVVPSDTVSNDCVFDENNRLVATPESLDFGVFLVGTSPEKEFVLTNKSSKTLRILSIAARNPEFVIAEPASLPVELAPCMRLKVVVRMTPEGITLNDVVSKVVVRSFDYATTEELLVPVTGIRLKPESVACQIAYRGTVELSLSGIHDVPDSMSNEGPGSCVVESIKIADCTVVDGVVKCPSPEDASDSKVFVADYYIPEDGIIRPFQPYEIRNMTIRYKGDRPEPPSLPAYGVLTIVSHENLTGTQRNYPEAVVPQDGTTNYPWYVVLKQ
jgi:hypothetical protein